MIKMNREDTYFDWNWIKQKKQKPKYQKLKIMVKLNHDLKTR